MSRSPQQVHLPLARFRWEPERRVPSDPYVHLPPVDLQSGDLTGWVGFIATSDVGNPALSPAPSAYDIHVYQTPSEF